MFPSRFLFALHKNTSKYVTKILTFMLPVSEYKDLIPERGRYTIKKKLTTFC